VAATLAPASPSPVLPGAWTRDCRKETGFPPLMTAPQVASVVRYLLAEAPEAMTGSLVEVFG
jgi:3-oxoacyl-[acyl-carrier protein] reductase